MKLFYLPMIINYARYEFNHLLKKSGNVLKIEASSLAIVESTVEQKRRSAPLELRWQQLNAACAMAIGLGLARREPDESEVFERWARLQNIEKLL